MQVQTAFEWVLVAILGVVTWLLFAPFLQWILATGVLAFVLFPVHRRLERHVGAQLSAGVLVVLVVVLVVVPLVASLYLVATRGQRLLNAISEAGALAPIERLLEQYTGIAVSLQSSVQTIADQLGAYVREQPSAILGQGLHTFLGFLLLTFILYYLLKDGRQFVAWLQRVTPLEPTEREELFAATDDMMWAVLKGHFFVAVIQGFVAGISLFVTGVPNAVVLTVVMMVLALVPIVGVAPVLGGAVVYLVVTNQPLAALFVVIWGMTSVAITDDYLRAMLIDRSSRMHSAFIFVGILGGTYLLGAIGLFLGPILVGLFKTTVEVFGESHGVTLQSGP